MKSLIRDINTITKNSQQRKNTLDNVNSVPSREERCPKTVGEEHSIHQKRIIGVRKYFPIPGKTVT